MHWTSKAKLTPGKVSIGFTPEVPESWKMSEL